jgi:hypothetical protein
VLRDVLLQINASIFGCYSGLLYVGTLRSYSDLDTLALAASKVVLNMATFR